MEVKSVSDISNILIKVVKAKQKEIKTIDFRLDTVESFINIFDYLNKNINNIEEDDLHLLKNTLLVYKGYVGQITLTSKTKYYQEQYKEMINNLHNSYEQLINNEDFINKTKH